jgi:suppressor for copper-sensitivity B
VIAAYLASFGRYGIPFNAVYGPGAPKGLALPELLTNETVLSALDEASKGTTKAKRTVSMIPNEPQTQ